MATKSKTQETQEDILAQILKLQGILKETDHLASKKRRDRREHFLFLCPDIYEKIYLDAFKR